MQKKLFSPDGSQKKALIFDRPYLRRDSNLHLDASLDIDNDLLDNLCRGIQTIVVEKNQQLSSHLTEGGREVRERSYTHSIKRL